CNVFDFALGLDTELAIVAISTPYDANPLDILDGKRFNALFLISNQTQSPNPTAIGEGDVFAIIIKLPSSLFVFYGSIVVLKLGIALLSGLFVLAILIEPGDSKIR